MKKALILILFALFALPVFFGVGEQRVYATENEPGSTEDTSQVTTEDNQTSEVMKNCSNGGGAQSLGWIACPIMTWAGEASEGIYGQFVEPSLRVEPQLFTGEKSNVRDGWTTFQGIANTIFVILFLVVIVSQLTGVGIDNYGIKKILPKLIVTAILINLSYFLCLLFVDISNILGNGFQALFDQLGSGLDPRISVEDSSLAAGKQIASTGVSLVGLGVLSSLVVMTGGIWGGPEIALSLVIGAIGVFVSIFFLFILLAARQAAIVVLVVISPVAVVCYALPNTKKISDKWLKLFEGLLLVYPIAGLLVGGGNYVSSLLLTTNGEGFFMALTAMITGILPIFFIPTVLKQSFSALGSLGGRIAGMGDKARVGAQNRAANTQAYRAAQDRAGKFKTRKLKEMDDKISTQSGRFAKLRRGLRGGQMGMTATREQFLKNEAEDADRADMMGEGYARAEAKQEADIDETKTANAEAMLNYGKATIIGGDGKAKVVNTNSVDDMKAYHEAALRKVDAAKKANDEEAAKNAMAEVKAAQNIMAKTDPGRSAIQKNLENAIKDESGAKGGVEDAASHIMSNFSDLFKSKNRGSHAMIEDIAKGTDLASVADKINGGTYAMAGTNKYTEETLAAADEGAIKGLIESFAKMDSNQQKDIYTTATRAIQKAESGNLSMKPEVEAQLKKIVDEYNKTAGGRVNPNAGGTGGGTSGGVSSDGTSLDIPHDRHNTPTNGGTAAGADFVSE